jgi:hypothetical protein
MPQRNQDPQFAQSLERTPPSPVTCHFSAIDAWVWLRFFFVGTCRW